MQKIQLYRITLLPIVTITKSMDHKRSNLSLKHYLGNLFQLLSLKEYSKNKEVRCVKKTFFSKNFLIMVDSDGSNNTGEVVLSVSKK